MDIVSAPEIDAADLLATLHARLARVANPANAPALQAYMKSSTPFLGVSAEGDRVGAPAARLDRSRRGPPLRPHP